MSLPSLSLKRPVLAIVMSVVIVLFGIIGYTFLGVREYPAIDPPVVTVRTNYTGANAEIVESQVTEPLEKAINGIQGIRTISSNSNLGSSTITVEFNLGTEMEQAANDVRDKVSQAVRNLPQDIDAPPVVTKSDANSDPIIFIPIQSRTRNIMELTDYAENVLLERLQTIPGVSQIQIFGQKRYAMRLWIDPLRLAAHQLTLQDIKNALDKENIELPAGKVRGNATELTVKTYGRLLSEDDFNNLILVQSENQIVRFKDIGEASLGPEIEETIARRNNVEGVSLAIIAQPGSNYVAIADEFYKRYESIKKDLPSDIIIDVGIDKSRYVRRAIAEVQETLVIAIVLVVMIVFLFFRDWMVAFRPLIDIPVSLIGAFFIMYICGFSINVLTLLAIVLATGLVVDDGIVVTENIFKKIEKGMDRRTAAKEGTEEIFFAVIATSITLAVVFLPIIFLQGFVGSLFREFGMVVAGAVLISAFVSLTLTPMLNVYVARKNNKPTRFYEWTEPFYKNLDVGYRESLASFMKQRWLVIPIILITFGAIYYYSGILKSELAPMEDRGIIRSPFTAAEGTDFDYTQNIAYQTAQMVMDSFPDEQRMVFGIVNPGFSGAGSANSGFLSIILKDPNERKMSQQDIAQKLGKLYKLFPEVRINPIQEQTISTGFAASFQQPVQFVIQNLDFEKLRTRLPKFMEAVKEDPTFQGPDVNLKFNKPELQINIDRLKASELGISVVDIANTLQLALSGRRFGYFFKSGKQYQVVGQVNRNNRDEPLDLKSFFVRNNQGKLIQLDNVVSMEENSNPPSIFHYNRYKSATISSGLAPGKTVGDGIKAMRALAQEHLDESFATELTGASRDFAESSSNSAFAFLLALMLIYLVLAAQFESFIDPFIIMSTVPLAIAGALFSLWMFNQTLNIFSQIGIIMLIGLVTKNGILIVEFANHQRAEGLSRIDAAIAGAASRLRPILMTSLATALGALPIALALGAGAQSRIPLGIVIIGGIMFSLILTLFVVPAVYSYFGKRTKV